MNIRHAFITATALLALPALAMAQTTFPTSIDFTNDNTGSVNVALTCNSGNPLVQDFDINEAEGVTFIVNGIVADTTYTIALTGLDTGYTTEPTSCVFSGEDLAIDGSNPCDFVATPVVSMLTVYKEWVDVGADIDQSFLVEVQCTNASLEPFGESVTIYGSFSGYGDSSAVGYFYPAPGEVSVCTGMEDTASFDSAVESDQGCSEGVSFSIGDDGSCTVINTVFYEGIPTLSQYGLVILVLLTLGVGMVGFRRFV
jgi:hypothetical protein